MENLISSFESININKDWQEFSRLLLSAVMGVMIPLLLSKFEHDLSIYPEKNREEWNNVFSGMKVFLELYDNKNYMKGDIERSKELTNTAGFVYRNLSNVID